AQDRGKSAAEMKAIIEAGPYAADEAKAKGLIDQVGEERDAEQAVKKPAGDGARLMDFADYAARARAAAAAPSVGAPSEAVIDAEGAILTGTGKHQSPFAGGQTIFSDDVAKAFYAAIEDTNVKAIVFRVSSPGGSDTASEQILAAVRAAKAAGK